MLCMILKDKVEKKMNFTFTFIIVINYRLNLYPIILVILDLPRLTYHNKAGVRYIIVNRSKHK